MLFLSALLFFISAGCWTALNVLIRTSDVAKWTTFTLLWVNMAAGSVMSVLAMLDAVGAL